MNYRGNNLGGSTPIIVVPLKAEEVNRYSVCMLKRPDQ